MLSDRELSDYFQMEKCQIAVRWKTVRLLSDGKLSDCCQMEDFRLLSDGELSDCCQMEDCQITVR